MNIAKVVSAKRAEVFQIIEEVISSLLRMFATILGIEL